MAYEFKVGQKFRNRNSVSDNSFQIINIFEHEGTKLITGKHYSPEVKSMEILKEHYIDL